MTRAASATRQRITADMRAAESGFFLIMATGVPNRSCGESTAASMHPSHSKEAGTLARAEVRKRAGRVVG